MRCRTVGCVASLGVLAAITASVSAQQERGACCRGAECTIETRQDCAGGCIRNPPWRCDGDTDGDGQVNPVDSGLVQAAFGSQDEADLCQYDLDCDGQINPVDSGIVQSLFGTCNDPRGSCGAPGVWQGPGTDCDPNPCAPPVGGACCLPDGTCEQTSGRACGERHGRFQGDGTSCQDGQCPPTGACCLPSGECENLTRFGCARRGGVFRGDGTDCREGQCPEVPGACCVPGGGGGGPCEWDNNIVPNGTNARAISPPGFPDIRVADDFRFGQDCVIRGFHADVIEDDSWTPGDAVTVFVYNDNEGSPGPIQQEVTTGFNRVVTGDVYFGRQDYDYWVEGLNIPLAPNRYWIGLRNPQGGGAGTNYWMTSDGGPDGGPSSTGFFSLDAGNTWQPEGDPWHHAFEIVSQGGGGGDQCFEGFRAECKAQDGEFFPNLNCEEIPCGDFVEIPSGEDCWVTNCDDTQFSFCENPIPADFFDPGSEPFDGVVRLGGAGPGEIDTQVMRLEPMRFPNRGFPQTQEVPIEIVQLNLVSCEPITVMFGNEEQQWDVRVSLSDQRPPPGQMVVTKEQRNGGTYEAEFLVQPVFTFIKVDDPNQVRVLDTGAEGIDPDRLQNPGAVPWVHALRNGNRACGPNFAPNVDEDDATGEQCCRRICHPGATATHCNVVGHDCSACPNGACCLGDGTCTIAEPSNDPPRSAKEVCEQVLGGEYKGDTTDCTDTDGDGLPDVYETNDCGPCGENDQCNTGTNPLRADTDGDGCDDGEEIADGTDPCDPCDYDPACVDNPCGACCADDGTCTDDVPASECRGRHFPETPCSDDPCAGDCTWDNGIVPNGTNARALSPPGFPDVRVADDFTFEIDCVVDDVHANIIEDAGWTDGGDAEVCIYTDTGGAGPGAALTCVTTPFTKTATGDMYFGRTDYDYWYEGLGINLAPGTYWLGLRNANGGGAGTNYWMTSDGGADGPTSDTGWFSLDSGGTWRIEGDGWHHAFEINP